MYSTTHASAIWRLVTRSLFLEIPWEGLVGVNLQSVYSKKHELALTGCYTSWASTEETNKIPHLVHNISGAGYLISFAVTKSRPKLNSRNTLLANQREGKKPGIRQALRTLSHHDGEAPPVVYPPFARSSPPSRRVASSAPYQSSLMPQF